MLSEKIFFLDDVERWPIEAVYEELELSTKFEKHFLGMKAVSSAIMNAYRTKQEFELEKEAQATKNIMKELIESVHWTKVKTPPMAVFYVLSLIIFRRINAYCGSGKEELMRARDRCYEITSEIREHYVKVGAEKEAGTPLFFNLR